MGVLRRGLSLFLCIILVVSIFGTACSNQSDEVNKVDKQQAAVDNNNNDASSKQQQPKELVGNPAANAGNVFRYASSAPNGVFNGILYSGIYDKAICNLVFDTLLKYDNSNLEFLPRLAEKWEMDEENKTLTFWIRQGVKIHNGLGEITAEDVAFTYKMIMEPEYDGAYYSLVNNIIGAKEYKEGNVDTIEGIVLYSEKPENPLPITYDSSEENIYKITFKLNELSTSNLHSAADSIFILPRVYYDKEKYEDFKALNLVPVGTGPMTYIRYVIDQFVELEAFDSYHGGRPKVDKIIYKCVTDDARIAEIQSGGIDSCEIRATDEDYGQVENLGFLHIDTAQGDRYAFMGFNFNQKIFKDIRVRKALTYGFNRQGFVDSYTGGRSGLTVAPVIRTSWAYPKEGLIKLEYNPDEANKLLDEAGWKMESDGYRYKDGKKFSISYTGVANNKYDAMKTAIMIEDYKKIGVELVSEFYEWASYLHNLKTNPNVNMFGFAWNMSPNPYQAKFTTGDPDNHGHYSNPKVDELMDLANKTLDTNEAGKLYREVFKIINNDLPYIFLNDYQICYCINNRVKNLNVAPFLDWTYDFHKVEIVQ